MTRVDARYELTGPITDELMEAISSAHSIYGLAAVKLTPAMDELLVQYDASRLKLPDVDRALRQCGLPVRRVEN